MAPQDERKPTGAPPSQQETGKFRASRIPLDYYKRPDRLDRWRRGLLGLAVMLAVGWIGWTLVRGSSGNMAFSRGPVATVHATWDEQCQACHVSAAAPIGRETRWLPAWFADTTRTPDQRCQTCHSGAIHHANQKAADTPSCAGCHPDHRGRDASLVHVPDQACTGCHVKLAEHMTSEDPHDEDRLTVDPYIPITRFDTNHPEFAAVKKSARLNRLKFNHKVHLAPGMDCQFTLDNIAAIDPANKQRYPAVQDENGKMVVKLDCSSCHQTDSNDFSKEVREKPRGLPADLLFPPRSAGAYMVPITYENQCAACHPLTVAKDPDKRDGALAAVPHRLQPPEVRQYLKDFYTRQYIDGHPELLARDFQPPRLRPGRPADPEVEKVEKVVQRKVETMARLLLEKNSKHTCSECHDYQGDPTKDASTVSSPNVNPIWLKHALFNHSAHRAVACQECHPGADASTKSDDVLIPAKDVCTTCHCPPSRTSQGPRGGARFDCVECHRYHNGNMPLQGLGARARAPQNKMDAHQFLSGSD